MSAFKHKNIGNEVPEFFGEDTVKTIKRIVENHRVRGVIYLRNDKAEMYTIPEIKAQVLTAKLPTLNRAMHNAVKELTATLNKVNPMVDRIMEDESVEGVVMLNKSGSPILTNISITNATKYGIGLYPFGVMAQNSIKEFDPFDNVVMIRLNTKKIEIMLAPDPEFNLIVLQRARKEHKTRAAKNNK